MLSPQQVLNPALDAQSMMTYVELLTEHSRRVSSVCSLSRMIVDFPHTFLMLEVRDHGMQLHR